MKINVSTPALREAVAQVQSVIGGVSITEGPPSVLLNAMATGLVSLTGTNLNQYLQRAVDCEVRSSGAVVLPIAPLAGIVRAIESDTISIQVDDNLRATIQGDESTYHLGGLPAKEYKELPDLPNDRPWTMGGDEVKSCLSRVAFAQSNDRSGSTLCGTLIEGDGESLNFVATNRRVLSIVRVKAPLKCKLIIPAEVVALLIKTLDKDQDVSIRADTHHVEFYWKGTTVISRLLEGSYPNYEGAMPCQSKYTGHAILNRDSVRKALVNVTAATNDKEVAPSVAAKFADGRLTLQAEHMNAAGKIGVPVQMEGSLEVTVNPSYLAAALGAMEESEVRLDWINALDPLVLTAKNCTVLVLVVRKMP